MVRTLRRASLKLSLLAALASVVVGSVHAQKSPERDFLMKLTGLTGRDQEKIVHASIIDQDPSALVSMDRPLQEVKIRTIVSLDRPVLEAAFSVFGVSIISLEPIAVLMPSERAVVTNDLPGFPVFTGTGDNVHDEEIYQSSKAAWIEAHPDLYPPTSSDHPATAPR